MNSLSDTFTKMNDVEADCIMESLDVYEKAMLFAIEPYVHYDNSIKSRNNVPLKMKDLVEMSGMSQRKAYNVISSLEEKCVVCKYKGVFYVNPWIFSKGVKINKNLKGIFADYLIRSRDMTPWIEL